MNQKPENFQETERYQKAYEEWSSRIGSARTQGRNWRFAFMLSVIILLLLSVCLWVVLASQKQYVYVAEVSPKESVVNLTSLNEPYTLDSAQIEYMLARFIDQTMSLPLDPVLARRNWINAYALVQGEAIQQLNGYAQRINPLGDLGTVTRTVEIQSFHPVSSHSYDFVWTVTEYNPSGKVINVTLYNGSFTVTSGVSPKNNRELLVNPFGLKIVYFNIVNQGA